MKSLGYNVTKSLFGLARRGHRFVAAGILTAMFGLALGSMVGNSAIVDEVAHVPAAYSYWHYGDYRLNPEHPPLIKDLAGLPLQFMRLRFPDDRKPWMVNVNGQWETGWDFLYHLGNDAAAVLFWSRLPVLLLAVGFGAFLYSFCRRRWGTAVGLLALFFYTFSPNVLAHATLVTTDLGVTVCIFLALVAFGGFVNRRTRKSFLLLSLALAAAQLAKFSAIVLYPFLGVVVLGLVWLLRDPKPWLQRLKVYVGGFIGASALSLLWIWVYYTAHTWNMPSDVQDRLIAKLLNAPDVSSAIPYLTALNDVSVFKGLTHYLLGLGRVLWRVSGGSVTYFNGEVTNQSFRGYFPQLFVMKTQIALLVLILAALGYVAWYFYRPAGFRERMKRQLRRHVLEWVLGGFAVFYFLVAVTSNLNLGIRHILPVYPPIFVLVAFATVKIGRRLVAAHWVKTSGAVLAALLLWYAGSTAAAYPSYLSYFNETIGGPANADKYFADSSVDWGQDLLRLKNYVEAHSEITRIAVDFFGGAVPEYHFCDRKYDDRGRLIDRYDGYDCSNSVYVEWHSRYGPYPGQYIAVSETLLQHDRWYSAINGTPGYEYLRRRKPAAKVGYSIYVYKLTN